MVKNHLKSIAAPKKWKFGRKKNKWLAKPLPGPHGLNNCLTVNFIVKNILNYAKTTKEVKKILGEGNVKIDKKLRKNYKFPVGIMDVFEVPQINQYYRVLYGKDGRLNLFSIDAKESNLKLLKIIRKNAVKNNKIQLTFHDGRNILLDKFDGKIGDTALFDIEKSQVSKFIDLGKGSLVYFHSGAYVGNLGKIKEIISEGKMSKPKVLVEVNGKDYVTLVDYAFVVGKDKPEIKIEVLE